MTNVIQFQSKPVQLMWAPKRGIRAAWRLLSQNGQLITLGTDRIKATIATDGTDGPDQTVEQFAIGVLRRIEALFGNCQPEGGCTERWSKLEKQNGQLWLDSYARGNCHNSVHQFKAQKNWNRPVPFPVWLPDLVTHLKPGAVLHVGLRSDPFQWIDAKYNITKRLIAEANAAGTTLVFHTMSDLCAHDDYISLIRWGGHVVVMHLGVGDDRAERLLSPGAPSVKRRHRAIQKLEAAGVPVYTKSVDIANFKDQLTKAGYYVAEETTNHGV